MVCLNIILTYWLLTCLVLIWINTCVIKSTAEKSTWQGFLHAFRCPLTCLPFPVISSFQVNVLWTVLVFAFRFSLSKIGRTSSPSKIYFSLIFVVTMQSRTGKKNRLNSLDNAYIHTIQIMCCFLLTFGRTFVKQRILGSKGAVITGLFNLLKVMYCLHCSTSIHLAEKLA